MEADRSKAEVRMGIDYITCTRCGEAFPDCMSYVTCHGDHGDGCCRSWCSDECAYADGHNNGWDEEKDESVEDSCKFCRREDVDDTPLLRWALKRLKLTRKQAVRLYFAAKNKR